MGENTKSHPVPEIPLALRVKLLEDEVHELKAFVNGIYAITNQTEFHAELQSKLRQAKEFKQHPPSQS